MIVKVAYVQIFVEMDSIEESEYSINTEIGDEVETELPPVTEPVDYAADYEISDKYIFGSFEQDNDPSNGSEPITWIVLAKDHDRLLLLSEKALELLPFNEDRQAIPWEDCTLRAWLNGEFMDSAFSDAERAKIIRVTNQNESNSRHGSLGGNATEDDVFLLSATDFSSYISNQENYDSNAPVLKYRFCYPTEFANERKETYYVHTVDDEFSWWLRSPGTGYTGQYTEYCSFVDMWGSINLFGELVSNYHGVRPAIWISLVP